MAKGPIDDILKKIAKTMASKANQRVRYEFMQATKNIPKGKSSLLSAKPKPKVKPKSKGKPKVKPKGRKNVTMTGKPVGKIARTTPPRPRRDYYPKGKTVPQTASEQRAAERLANRMLRQAGLKPEIKPPTKGGKPVDVRGSIIQPPSKASMRPPKPSKGSFEADPMRRAMADDKAAGLTKRTPKRQKAKPKVKNQPKGTKPNPPAKRTPTPKNTKPRTSSRPQGNIKPQTPAQRKAASKRVADRKSKKAAIEGGQIPMSPQLKLAVENARLRRNGARAFDSFPDTLK